MAPDGTKAWGSVGGGGGASRDWQSALGPLLAAASENPTVRLLGSGEGASMDVAQLSPSQAAGAVNAVVGELHALRSVVRGLVRVLGRSAPPVHSSEGEVLAALQDAAGTMQQVLGREQKHEGAG